MQGRIEQGMLKFNKGPWNTLLLDQLFQFPNPLVHDDLIDSLAYIDQMARIAYDVDFEEEDYQYVDAVAGY